MKEGDLFLNWQKKPVAILLCSKSNEVFWFECNISQKLSYKQIKALFFSEEGLQGANLRGANLNGVDLNGANLYGADLRGAVLRFADMTGANLTGANLHGANLRCAYLTGAKLKGVHHNHDTVWPYNFNKSRLSS